MWGGPHHHDPMLESLADSTGLLVVSTAYRFAPEYRYPAAPDDCEAAALWLHHKGLSQFGHELVAIGGESAGAHLAAVTCLRLRDRHGLAPFRAALLTYGCYDLRGTPSVRAFGDRPLILNTSSVRWFVEQFTGNRNLDDPDVSPIRADLEGLPPALFTVGSLDPMLGRLHVHGRPVEGRGESCGPRHLARRHPRLRSVRQRLRPSRSQPDARFRQLRSRCVLTHREATSEQLLGSSGLYRRSEESSA